MKFLSRLNRLSLMMGINPARGAATLSGIPWYLRDYLELKKQAEASSFVFPFSSFFPCLTERKCQSGGVSGHYFYQDLRVARRIFELNPQRHVDVGSRIDGFVAHVASFRPIEVFDIRPMDVAIHNVTFRQADLMNLDEMFNECTDSLSCLHTIEHFGLGRYGDPVDFDGFDKGLKNLTRMLKPGGRFHFSTPMGPQRIEFNAHRVFSASFLKEYFSQSYDLERFSYIDDSGNLFEDVAAEGAAFENNFGSRYGCAILELVKR